MLTLEEKLQEVELACNYIEAVNHVLLDALGEQEYSGEGDYITLLYVQKKHIQKIRALF